MACNILLINPWIHDFTAFDLWAKPLGLLYIASVLHSTGYKVGLIDCLHYEGHIKKRRYTNSTGHFFSQEIAKPSVFNTVPRRFKRYGMPIENFQEIILKYPKPLLICITSHMTYWYPGVFEAIKTVKMIFPSVPVVLGGIYATLCYEHAKKNSGADYIIKGEGELEVLQLADNLSNKERDYSRIKDFIRNDVSPAYELYHQLDSVSVITSRGCPFRCTYCASAILNRRFVVREHNMVVAEIEKCVKDLEVKDIAFYDDALFVNPANHIIPILKLLISKKLNVRFHTPNGLHPRYISKELAELLWIAGFRTLRLSFEGLSKHIQSASSEKVATPDLVQALNHLRDAPGVAHNNSCGVRCSSWDIGIYILMGLPEQTYDEVVNTMNFINKIGCKIRLAEYSPVPGTEEFQKAKKLCPDILKEPLIHNKSNFATIGMGIDYQNLQELKSLAKRLNSSIA